MHIGAVGSVFLTHGVLHLVVFHELRGPLRLSRLGELLDQFLQPDLGGVLLPGLDEAHALLQIGGRRLAAGTVFGNDLLVVCLLYTSVADLLEGRFPFSGPCRKNHGAFTPK